MHEFLKGVYEALLATSAWEGLAVFLSFLYLFLAMRQNLWCWVSAFFSTLIYTILFFDASLLMDSALNAYYLIMAVYGWYAWKHGKRANAEREVSSWGVIKHLKIVLLLTVLSLLIGYVMDTYTRADFAYLDSATTVFAIFTTYMLAQKILENWLYWIVIDAVSIYIYIQKAFYLTAVLFLCYTLLAILGFYQWKYKR
jgi:nicotinamide mononucleotide transporter